MAVPHAGRSVCSHTNGMVPIEPAILADMKFLAPGRRDPHSVLLWSGSSSNVRPPAGIGNWFRFYNDQRRAASDNGDTMPRLFFNRRTADVLQSPVSSRLSNVSVGSSVAVAIMSAVGRVNPRQRTLKRTAAQAAPLRSLAAG